MMDIDYGPDRGYDADYEAALNDLRGDYDPRDDDPAYADGFDADERAANRADQLLPKRPGSQMIEDGAYGAFCATCWYAGDLTGFHPGANRPAEH